MNPRNLTREVIEQLNDIEPYCFETDREEQWFNVGLQYGLDVADSDPKSLWINSEDDLPCYHMDLIYETEISEGTETVSVFAANEDGYIWDDYMIYENGKWRWNDFKPVYWMIPPKLPKERKQNYGTKNR